MKFLQHTIVIALLSFIAQLFLPWWIIAPIAFIVGYALSRNGGQAFGAAFLGIFLLWAGYAFLIDQRNEHILSTRIATLFPLGGNYWVLILITGVVGGLVAGLSALSGRLIKNIM